MNTGVSKGPWPRTRFVARALVVPRVELRVRLVIFLMQESEGGERGREGGRETG